MCSRGPCPLPVCLRVSLHPLTRHSHSSEGPHFCCNTSFPIALPVVSEWTVRSPGRGKATSTPKSRADLDAVRVVAWQHESSRTAGVCVLSPPLPPHPGAPDLGLVLEAVQQANGECLFTQNPNRTLKLSTARKAKAGVKNIVITWKRSLASA